ncbi:MAG: serine/threonine-protein kinase [Methylococcales bacterium]|nr:serine/threonine-protein kinase [Methylococcales bacterium]
MLEQSHINPDDTDVTRIKSEETNGETILNPTLSAPQITTSEEATRLMSSYGDGSPTDSQLVLGSVVKNTFQLVSVLGEGGMGTVFKALNKVWEEVEARDPYVAIKVLKPELSANKQLVRSLYSDFDRTKMLANCPNIIKVHGFDRDGPHVYMTMEYLSGKTLGDYLNREPMGLMQAWFIIEGIGNALAYAHENNIVHRDIKPGNIIITDEGVVKVLDFGIASKINENEGDETKFGGHELGALTVAYASPEMQRDYPPDARDDIYAFACVIYEILTGKQFYKQKTHKAAPIHGLNSRQMDILNKSLAFERDLRTSTIYELLDKLRPVKTPWLHYIGIGSGAFIVLGLALWATKELTTEKQLFDAPIQVSAPTPEIAQTQTPTPEPIPVEPPVTTPAVSTPEPPVVATPTPEPLPINTEISHSSTSSDGVVHLQTSRPEYKNGDPFYVSFTLTEPRYVRVIDRDAKGELSTLRPNPRQPDKLLPANKQLVFPPDNIDAPVQGVAGNNTVTIVVSSKPFPKNVQLLNDDGSVAEQVKNGSYSWTQVRYALR